MNKRILFFTILLILILILLIVLVTSFSISFIKNKNSNTINENKNQEKEDEISKELEKFTTFKNVGLTNSKCINTNNNYSLKKFYNGISLELTNDGKVYVSFNLNDDDIKSFGYNNIKLTNDKKEITGFSSKVIDIYLGTVVGTMVDYPIMLFLTENGTVEYVNSKDLLENLNLTSKGSIPQLNNVVRINSVHSIYGYSQIAIKDDGTYLDIQKILSTNNITYGSNLE